MKTGEWQLVMMSFSSGSIGIDPTMPNPFFFILLCVTRKCSTEKMVIKKKKAERQNRVPRRTRTVETAHHWHTEPKLTSTKLVFFRF